jgi:hypothetical protein
MVFGVTVSTLFNNCCAYCKSMFVQDIALASATYLGEGMGWNSASGTDSVRSSLSKGNGFY